MVLPNPILSNIFLNLLIKKKHSCYLTKFSKTFIILWSSRGRYPGFLVPALLSGPISFFYSRKTAHWV